MPLVAKSIKLKKRSRVLAIEFSNGELAELDFEYLRVFSPSAEVRGHGIGQEVLQYGKKEVAIEGLEAIGHYALKISFDDGHDSGLYTWQYLLDLHQQFEQNWQGYLKRLADAGLAREANTQVLKFQ